MASSAIRCKRSPVPALFNQPLRLHLHRHERHQIDISKMRGKVHFWTIRDPAWMEQFPSILAHYQKLHGKGLEIVGLFECLPPHRRCFSDMLRLNRLILP
jgi:hypothetical protein